mgnify:CR=1 FL=1
MKLTFFNRHSQVLPVSNNEPLSISSRLGVNESIQEQLGKSFYENEKVKTELDRLETQVKMGTISPFVAAHKLISLFQSL